MRDSKGRFVKGCVSTFKGKKHTVESKLKQSESHMGNVAPKSAFKKGQPSVNKGKKLSIEHRKKLSESHKGKKLTDSHKRKLSESRKGVKNHFFGKTHSDETRGKISQAKRKFSNEQRKIRRYLSLKKYNLKNREKQKAWAKKHPANILSYHLKRLTTNGLFFNFNSFEYNQALYMWRKTVKTRDIDTCQICNKTAINAHHIFHRARYPALSLNVNNGIALCRSCHNEAHGWRM